MEIKVLVALDDSENAMRAVRFITKCFTREHKITLFSVVPDLPAICDMGSPGLTPYFLSKRDVFCSIEDQKRELVEDAMKKAKALLLDAGFEEKNIETKVQTQKEGVARDILHEAHSGYDAVVLGRRGLSGIKEFLLGSVSQKVLHLAKDVSILVVD